MSQTAVTDGERHSDGALVLLSRNRCADHLSGGRAERDRAWSDAAARSGPAVHSLVEISVEGAGDGKFLTRH